MTGEVSVVVTSVAEQAQLIRGGQLRPLAVLIPESFVLAGKTLPSAFDSYPGLSEYLPISQAIGFAIKADAPDDIKAVLIDAFNKALMTDTFVKWAEENYYVVSGATGSEGVEIFNKLESLFAWTLWDLQAAKVDPATLGIPKP